MIHPGDLLGGEGHFFMSVLVLDRYYGFKRYNSATAGHIVSIAHRNAKKKGLHQQPKIMLSNQANNARKDQDFSVPL